MSLDATIEEAHCRRTAALAVELGRRAGLPPGPIEQTALLHHSLDSFQHTTGLGRLAWHVVAGEDARRIGDIVQICNLVDEQMEALEFEFKDIDTILDEIQSFAVFEGYDARLVDHLRDIRCEGVSRDWQVPVEAQTACDTFRALRAEGDYELPELERLALRDPSLAANLVRVANSALYGRATRISTVARAIASIGTVGARKIMLAATMRPLFASAGLTSLWSHSLSSAPLCGALAGTTGLITAEEGLVLGLVHDIGAIAVQFLPHENLKTHRNLIEAGCPPVYVERLMLGQDHGEIGADLIAGWNFPAEFVEAVRFHHQPERSVSDLAAMAYLAEFWSGLDEDIASFGRVEACLERTGITVEILMELGKADAALNMLRSVA